MGNLSASAIACILSSPTPPLVVFQCKKAHHPHRCRAPATVAAGMTLKAYCHVGDEVVEPNHPVIFVWTLTLASLMLWLGIKLTQMMTSMLVMELEGRSPRKSLPNTSWNWNESEGGKPFTALSIPIGRSPSGTDRETTWQDAFDKAGLVCDLADDSDVGRAQLNVYLRPDPDTRRPRITWDRSCGKAIYQMKRFLWDDRKGPGKDQKTRRRMMTSQPSSVRHQSNPDFRATLPQPCHR